MSNSIFLPTIFPETNNLPNPYETCSYSDAIDSYDHHHHHQDFSDYLQLLNLPEEDPISSFNTGICLPHSHHEVFPEGSSGSNSFNSITKFPTNNHMKCKSGPKRAKMEVGCKVAFRTKSVMENMDDGFKWKKYGKKKVKSSPYPRNYYKCSIDGCYVKKRVERDRDNSSYVITTYEGVHNH